MAPRRFYDHHMFSVLERRHNHLLSLPLLHAGNAQLLLTFLSFEALSGEAVTAGPWRTHPPGGWERTYLAPTSFWLLGNYTFNTQQKLLKRAFLVI